MTSEVNVERKKGRGRKEGREGGREGGRGRKRKKREGKSLRTYSKEFLKVPCEKRMLMFCTCLNQTTTFKETKCVSALKIISLSFK